MIQGKEKVEKIYNYLSNLENAHQSSEYKDKGWTLYNKNDKNLGFSIEKYNWKNNIFDFEITDVNFNQKDSFWGDTQNYKRIYINIKVDLDSYKLEIKECQVKDGADLAEFFRKLDEFVEKYCDMENRLEKLLLSKIGE